MPGYAIISLGGKQYRVAEGDRLLVDRVSTAEGKTFLPEVLFTGGSGKPNLAPRVQVTAKVVSSPLGEKIRIGKYRRRTGYRRHNGFRARLSEIEIQSIGARSSSSSGSSTTAAKKDTPKSAAKPKAPAKKPAAKKAPARKPATKKKDS
jgi:large subunit ribosomal protein L21